MSLWSKGCITAAMLSAAGMLAPGAMADDAKDAKFWRQLTALMTPVEMASMTDHRAYMLPGGLIIATHFDDMDLAKAENLNWVAVGFPGKNCKSDQARLETAYGKGFTHFHSLKNDTHGGEKAEEGVWFVHVAVRDFEAPWGKVAPGPDLGFMPTEAPDC